MNYRRHLTLWILISLICLSCERDISVPSTEEVSQRPSSTTLDQRTDSSGAERDRSLQSRINEVNVTAQKVYSDLGIHRNRIFENAFSQAEIIVCSTYRMERLVHGHSQGFYRYGKHYTNFVATIKQILARQRFLVFVETSRKEYDLIYRSIYFSIPQARAYGGTDMAFTNFVLNGTYMTKINFSFDPERLCGEAFLAPIPNLREARDSEVTCLATMLARAIRRLEGSIQELRYIERGTSKANSLRLILTQLSLEMKSDTADPEVTRQKMQEYERQLEQAILILETVPRRLRENYSVDTAEVQRIRQIFDKV